jgi:TPR repeat protein
MRSMPDRIRLPLQVGTSALWSLARVSAGVVPGLVLLATGLRLLGSSTGLGLLLGAFGAFLLAWGAAHLVRAWRTRASDAVLSSAGLELDGGPSHGLRVAWAEIDPGSGGLETVGEKRLTLARLAADAIFVTLSTLLSDRPERAPATRVPIRRLVLATRDGRRRLLAQAEHPDEQASLDALQGSIDGRVRPAPPARLVNPDPRVLRCGACGAPAPPADTPMVACRHCRANVAVPPEIREKLAAHRGVRQAQQGVAGTVQRLLRQPGARRANLVLAICAAACAAGWGVVAAVLLRTGFDNLGGFELGWLLGTGLALTAAAFLLGRLALVERGALQLLATGFGSGAPRDATDGHRCRACGAPLPEETGSLVARCAYCDADNIVGLDLRTELEPSRARERDLAGVLARRRTARRRWLGASLGAAALVLLAGTMGAASISLSRELAGNRDRCAAGDGAACTAAAAAYALGIGVGEDDARACALQREACRLDDAEGCYRLSESLRWGWGTAADEAAARTFRSRACELGWSEACGPVEEP